MQIEMYLLGMPRQRKNANYRQRNRVYISLQHGKVKLISLNILAIATFRIIYFIISLFQLKYDNERTTREVSIRNEINYPHTWMLLKFLTAWYFGFKSYFTRTFYAEIFDGKSLYLKFATHNATATRVHYSRGLREALYYAARALVHLDRWLVKCFNALERFIYRGVAKWRKAPRPDQRKARRELLQTFLCVYGAAKFRIRSSCVYKSITLHSCHVSRSPDTLAYWDYSWSFRSAICGFFDVSHIIVERLKQNELRKKKRPIPRDKYTLQKLLLSLVMKKYYAEKCRQKLFLYSNILHCNVYIFFKRVLM